MEGCGKVINPHRVCGDISFANVIILCEECGKDFLKPEENLYPACKGKEFTEKDNFNNEHCIKCGLNIRYVLSEKSEVKDGK